MVTMHIGIDLDETLVDFMRAYVSWHNIRHGTQFNVYDIKTANFWETMGYDKSAAIERVAEFYQSEEHDNIQPLNYAREILEMLKPRKLTVVSVRPLWMMERTRRLVERNFPGLLDEVYLTNQWGNKNHCETKAEVCLRKGIELMIDDSHEVIADCTRRGLPSIHLEKYWGNSLNTPDGALRGNSWREIFQRIMEIESNLGRNGQNS